MEDLTEMLQRITELIEKSPAGGTFHGAQCSFPMSVGGASGVYITLANGDRYSLILQRMIG
jgi:hypothetical protein